MDDEYSLPGLWEKLSRLSRVELSPSGLLQEAEDVPLSDLPQSSLTVREVIRRGAVVLQSAHSKYFSIIQRCRDAATLGTLGY